MPKAKENNFSVTSPPTPKGTNLLIAVFSPNLKLLLRVPKKIGRVWRVRSLGWGNNWSRKFQKESIGTSRWKGWRKLLSNLLFRRNIWFENFIKLIFPTKTTTQNFSIKAASFPGENHIPPKNKREAANQPKKVREPSTGPPSIRWEIFPKKG